MLTNKSQIIDQKTSSSSVEKQNIEESTHFSESKNRHHRLCYLSSYDRGLNVLLAMWPDIKDAFPDATLDIAYGWDLFDRVTANNAERQEWKKRMVELMDQPGITHRGRIGKEELKKLREECGILAYPSDFTEIFCITVVEAQKDGCVPVTTDAAALKETVVGGITVKGDIYDHVVKKEYLERLLELMGDQKKWEELQAIGKKFAQGYTWDKIAKKWTDAFTKHQEDVKVSIVTPTIRRGFWNIMANNIANQTYKNLEWIIVDDYPTDRAHIAKEYAEKYNIDIKYYRGKERKTKRHFGLVNANNTGLQNATGELLVVLQDFILMPLDGVETMVMLFRKNPNTLQAPVDRYYAPKIKPDTESEDWFHGELDVQGEFMRENIRIQNKGLRFTDHPYDFEQNYCAIPKHIAEALGGWYEFMDEGLGFDNTEFALRALMAGYKIVLDETNVCICIDHWETLKGTTEHGMGREKRLSDPRFLWEKQMLEDGKLPLKRTQEIDDKIELLYTIPDEVPNEDAVDWMRDHLEQTVSKWLKEVKI